MQIINMFILVVVGLLALGSIPIFVAWLSPIRRFLRKHHGTSLELELLKSIKETRVYFLLTGWDVVQSCDLRTFLRKLPRDARPDSWILVLSGKSGDKEDVWEKSFFKDKHWKEFNGCLSFLPCYELVDRGGNRFRIWGQKDNDSSWFYEQALLLVRKFEDTRHHQLYELARYTQQALREAQKCSSSVPIMRLSKVWDHYETFRGSNGLIASYAEEAYPTAPPT
jgi:hypothetical protein